MLVRLAKTPHHRPTKVRVRSSVGHAVVLWGGDPEEAEGRHNVEWSVDEDIRWGHNTQPAAIAKPGFWQHGDQVVMRGRVHFTEDGAAVLVMGDSQILFNLAAPPPESIDRAWVEISAEADKITLWPFRL
ncbi:hypothetical protein [Actinoallomurus iriomotensis]|uniref:Uncharacterized protein n=1 Tax=Actinoallomurus iriomotensis TaxID=478107 RepID=A0A9W6RGJ8_9ACTN|nr:hypothetical protein [Actinoallomurus iriomotensis]GLY74205.1 hypothetical protein Airi01_024720 [Actinoallomurus iriomotensis]